MSDDSFQSFLMTACIDRFKDLHIKRSASTRRDSLNTTNDYVQTYAKGCPGWRSSLPQLKHQLSHPVERILDCHQHILLEFRVITQSLGIFHHQRELRDNVL